ELRKPGAQLNIPLNLADPVGRRVGPNRVPGAQCMAPLECRQGIGKPPLFPEYESQGAVGLGMVGMAFEGLAEGSLRHAQPLLVLQGMVEQNSVIPAEVMQVIKKTLGIAAFGSSFCRKALRRLRLATVLA